MAGTKILSWSRASICLVGAIVILSSGCRTPLRSSLTGKPDYDHLTEADVDDSRSARSRNPISSGLRPGSSPRSTDRYAKKDSRSSKRKLRRPVDALEADEEYQESYAAASPAERILLDRFGDAIRNKSEQSAASDRLAQAEKKSSPPAARRTITDSDDGRSYRLSDSDDEVGDINASPKETRLTSRRNPLKSREPARDNEPVVRTASSVQPLDASDPSVELASHEHMGEHEGQSPEPDQADDLANYELRELAHAMIAHLEETITDVSNPDEKIDLAKKRRLINLVLDDIDAAQEPIDGLQTGAQDYVHHTFQGLFDAMDLNGNPSSNRRMTLALLSHRRAAESLSALANLEVLNVAFCTEVDSFGVITKLPQYQFRPGQLVLLYCEIENLVSESVKGGYQTQLQGDYEIVDSRGRRVADQLLPEDLDMCGNKRRDFYIAYKLYIPDNIEPGHHKLKMTIEDMKGHKFGQASIDFQIVR